MIRHLRHLLVAAALVAIGACRSINAPEVPLPSNPTLQQVAAPDQTGGVTRRPGLPVRRQPVSSTEHNFVPVPLHTPGATQPPPDGHTLPAIELVSAWVDAGEVKSVGSGDYRLHFSAGSLSQGAEITIKQWDSHYLDFELGPHGIQFGTPVVLELRYDDTNADPECNEYDGTIPACYGFNENTQKWEEIPSVDDRESRTIRCDLYHFSRYMVGGRAGW